MKTKTINKLLNVKENSVYNITDDVRLYNFVDNQQILLKLDLTNFTTIYNINIEKLKNDENKIKNEILSLINNTLDNLKERIITEMEMNLTNEQ